MNLSGIDSVSHVLICDDHPVVQMGLEVSLRQFLPNLKSISLASNAKQALDFSKANIPDIALIDVGLPDMSGVDLIKALWQKSVNIKVIVVTSCDNPMIIKDLKEMQVSAIMHKFSSPEQFHQILEKVVRNSIVGDTIMDLYTHDLISEHKKIEFTPKEYEVLQEIIKGKSNHQIAELLGCGVTTVRFHRANIMSKTNIRSAAELTAWFLQGQRKRD